MDAGLDAQIVVAMGGRGSRDFLQYEPSNDGE